MIESPAHKSDVIWLYQAAEKIYPRSVSGRFARLRWVMVAITQLVFYGLPWLAWNGRQAVLFDTEYFYSKRLLCPIISATSSLRIKTGFFVVLFT